MTMEHARWHARCRICDAMISRENDRVLSLGSQPLANALQPTRELAMALPMYPLEVLVCSCCSLAQLSVAVDKELLFGGEYAYQTPASEELSVHYEAVNRNLERLGMPEHAFVVEVGSNNGEFLLHMPAWAKTKLGVEPSINVGEMARKRGVETIIDFFCPPVARSIRKQFGVANVVVLRHCLAHVDNMHEIIESAAELIDEDGVLYIENAYWPSTVGNVEYGQIYHEHMSYVTVRALQELLHRHGLKIVDVDLSVVHGGSIMIYADKKGTARMPTASIGQAIAVEALSLPVLGLGTGALRFLASDVALLIEKLRHFVKHSARKLYLYGASAKASTILNASGLTYRDIVCAFDASPIKHGKFMPGSRLEILDTDLSRHIDSPADSVCMLSSSTYETEILSEQHEYTKRGGHFVSLVRRGMWM